MKLRVGSYKIKRHYTLVQLVLDIVSAGLLYLIWQTFASLVTAVSEINSKILGSSANVTGIKLSWYPALILPVIAVLFVAATLFFTFRSRKMPKKFTVSERTAQKYYDLIILAVSAIRLVVLLGIFDMTYIQSMLILQMGDGVISIQVICDIILVIIIIKFIRYRIFILSEKDKETKQQRRIIEN